MSICLAHILLNKGVAELTIPLNIKLSKFIILLLKLNTNLCKSLPKDVLFSITS